MKMNCECGHEKRDHGLPRIGTQQGYGKCKICLCDQFVKAEAPLLAGAAAGKQP